MAEKLAEFLKKSKIDTRRLLAVSRRLERLRPEDRAIILARRTRRREAAEGGEAKTPADPRRPRSGRPVTPPQLAAALAGKPVPAPAKTRILRAVNHVLELRKADKVGLDSLF